MAGRPVAGSTAEGLMSGGIAVHDGFISERQVAGLIRCALRRRLRGDFSAARIGADHRLQLRDEIRGDHTCWFAHPFFEEERALLQDLEQLRLDLNREAYLGLFDLELHHAWYAPGTAYARHVDQPHGRDRRTVSLVLY